MNLREIAYYTSINLEPCRHCHDIPFEGDCVFCFHETAWHMWEIAFDMITRGEI